MKANQSQRSTPVVTFLTKKICVEKYFFWFEFFISHGSQRARTYSAASNEILKGTLHNNTRSKTVHYPLKRLFSVLKHCSSIFNYDRYLSRRGYCAIGLFVVPHLQARLDTAMIRISFADP